MIINDGDRIATKCPYCGKVFESFYQESKINIPKQPLIKDERIDYFEIKRLVKDAMREAEEERVNRLAQYYATLCGEEE